MNAFVAVCKTNEEALEAIKKLGIKKESFIKYEKKVSDGNFLVIAQGNLKEVKKAKQILHTEGKQLEWNNV